MSCKFDIFLEKSGACKQELICFRFTVLYLVLTITDSQFVILVCAVQPIDVCTSFLEAKGAKQHINHTFSVCLSGIYSFKSSITDVVMVKHDCLHDSGLIFPPGNIKPYEGLRTSLHTLDKIYDTFGYANSCWE